MRQRAGDAKRENESGDPRSKTRALAGGRIRGMDGHGTCFGMQDDDRGAGFERKRAF